MYRYKVREGEGVRKKLGEGVREEIVTERDNYIERDRSQRVRGRVN